MRYTVIVSNRARQMLGQHLRFLAQVNRAAAVELKKRFMQELCPLENFPQRYPFFDAEFIPPNRYHKLYIANCFIVLHQIKDDVVYVEWIVDCRQDYRWLLK